MEIKQNFPLQKYNTFGLDIDCAYYAEVESKEDLLQLMADESLGALPKFWLGGGSNTLFLGNFPGLVIRLTNKKTEVLSQDSISVRLRVEAGEVWSDLVKKTVQQGWWGLENLTDIPGSVGGAAVQNMGAYGAEIADCVESVEVFDTETCRFYEIPQKECGYAYRESRFKRQDKIVVWSVILRLSKLANPKIAYAGIAQLLPEGKESDLEAIAKAVASLREQKLPDLKQLGCAGSFFTNPVVGESLYNELKASYPDLPAHKTSEGFKLSAAWLIDQCGWKGYREGDAGVYQKQALVLVNHGSATGEEIWNLAIRIKNKVAQKFKVEINPEVCVVGEHCQDLELRYRKILDVMYHSLPMFHRIGAAAYKPNLKNTEQMMDALGHPYRKFRSIHVAGTNGKGSCSHLLASVFQAAGYKTGLYTSPHLRDFRERIRINGQMISKPAVVEFYERNQEMFRSVQASFFEMTVAMAFDYFAKEKVDIAIIEVGMGGRLDSTNVITPCLSLITNISFDHMQFLGDTLPKIAAEKAGIIKEGVPVVISESQASVNSVFSRFAQEKNAPILFADSAFSLQNIRNERESFSFDLLKYGQPYLENLCCDIAGDRYECKNIAGVMAALDILQQQFNLPQTAIRQGIAHAAQSTGFMGRWQCLDTNPLVYCDTGHNEAGIRLVLQQISKMEYKKLHIVWGMVKDKDIGTILSLLPVSAAYYFCKAPQERALPVQDLLEAAQQHGLNGKAYDSVPQALEAAKKQADKDDLIYVGGSTFVVAEIC